MRLRIASSQALHPSFCPFGAKAQSRRCSSLPHQTHFVGLCWGPRDLFRQKFVRKTLKYAKYVCGFTPFSDEKSPARLTCRFVRYCLLLVPNFTLHSMHQDGNFVPVLWKALILGKMQRRPAYFAVFCGYFPEQPVEICKVYAISPLTGKSFECIMGSNLILFQKAMMGKSNGILRRTESWAS